MTQKISFSKMHGLGNDFVLIDGINQNFDINSLPISLLADRHRGIGFDQLLLLIPSKTATVGCKIFNADGSQAEQCGNGLRCVTKFLKQKMVTSTSDFSIETKAGIFDASIDDSSNLISVSMGKPFFEEEVTFNFNNNSYSYIPLTLGNPHAIIFVPELVNYPVKTIGEYLSKNSVFPQGVNVGFSQIEDEDNIILRTYERGVGETFACGSNACAAVAAGIRKNYLKNCVKVKLQWGDLTVAWQEKLLLCGQATFVYEGTLEI